jgi:hypothetical protein
MTTTLCAKAICEEVKLYNVSNRLMAKAKKEERREENVK